MFLLLWVSKREPEVIRNQILEGINRNRLSFSGLGFDNVLGQRFPSAPGESRRSRKHRDRAIQQSPTTNENETHGAQPSNWQFGESDRHQNRVRSRDDD